MTSQNTIEDKSREQIASFLPDAIALALESYHRFSGQRVPDEAKEFKDHHNACKVAIAHIELLIKLARWADLPDQDAAQNNMEQAMLAAIMQEAQAELEAYEGKDED